MKTVSIGNDYHTHPLPNTHTDTDTQMYVSYFFFWSGKITHFPYKSLKQAQCFQLGLICWPFWMKICKIQRNKAGYWQRNNLAFPRRLHLTVAILSSITHWNLCLLLSFYINHFYFLFVCRALLIKYLMGGKRTVLFLLLQIIQIMIS